MLRFGRLRSACMIVVLMLALASAALAQPASPIAIGPYVQNVGKDSATICWATVSGQMTYAGPDGRAVTRRDYEHHEVVLRYLQPGTTYTYNVLGDEREGGEIAFTTFAEGEHPFSFVTLPDCHNQRCEPIIKVVMKDRPDMAFPIGDMVYDGLQMWHWEDFLRVNRELMRSVPYYTALGNHELDSPIYFTLFALPGNERYYSFDRGAVHFVVLDSFGPRMRDVYWEPGEMTTNQPVTKRQLEEFEQQKERYWQEQLAWLRDDLAQYHNAKYIFVFFHHPPYTALSKGLEGAREIRERFGTIFEDYGVSAVFNGHHHHYHHALVGGVHFVMTCAGGDAREPDAPQPETLKCAKGYNFARVEVASQRTSVRIIGVDGETIDEFEIAARSAD